MEESKRLSWLAQIERLRQATPDERLQAAARQREIDLELLRAGLRFRFPGLDEAGIEGKVGEIIFGAPRWRDVCERRERRRLSHRPDPFLREARDG